jgi:fused signal recognition particle receptor
MGLLDKFKQGLEKTKALLFTDVRDLFKSEGELVDDPLCEKLYARLIRTDMGVKPAQELVDAIKTEFRGRVVHLEDMVAVFKKKLREVMAQDEAPLKFAASGPTVIMVAGVNGAGKTTSIAKLAKICQNKGKKVVLGAGDTFRAAAVEQLTIWSQRLGCAIVKGASQSDPASVAHRAVAETLATGADVCIVDTAGRLQTQQNLMQELTKIHRVIGKQIPEAPHEVLLVLDATTGQNGISQAKHFTEAVKCTGLILAKLDGTAKGGVAVAIRQQVALPVKFVGVGEQMDDLVTFDAGAFVDALFEEVGKSAA